VRSITTSFLAGFARSLIALALFAVGASGATAAMKDLSELSLEDLMEIEVTSVSKRAQPLLDSPAAVSVLTGEEIQRAGHNSIPEALRMVPGVHVARIDANKWAISSRGFNGRFANKMLVLIDGRSVYTPAFAGTYWEFQDVAIEDVERIEVIRGPGSAVWGANAVNGVVNVITKSSRDTEGALMSAAAGDYDRLLTTARFGASTGDDFSYRATARYRNTAEYPSSLGAGGDAHDAWDVGRGSFRADWDVTDRDRIMFQGGAFKGDAEQQTILSSNPLNPLAMSDTDFNGSDVLVRWNRDLSDSQATTVQFWWDRYERDDDFAHETRNTFDLEFQHDITGDRNVLNWGLNYRASLDDVDNSPLTNIQPTSDTAHLIEAFIQDQYEIVPGKLSATVGTKLGWNSYSNFEIQPTARLLYAPHEKHRVWAAVTRAVRTPSRIDHDLSFRIAQPFGGPPNPVLTSVLLGNSDVGAEDLMSYELGWRGALRSDLTLDAAAYFMDYDKVRTFEAGAPVPTGFNALLGVPTVDIPVTIDDKMNAQSYGLELQATWQPQDRWKLSFGYTYMHLRTWLDGGSTDILSADAENDYPSDQLFLVSSLDLPLDLQLDAALYWVDAISGESVSSYWRGDLRVGWQPRPGLELSLVGQNLLQGEHQEYGDIFNIPSNVPRSFYAMVTWRR
jgi:iron complex outermembrane receptor protein